MRNIYFILLISIFFSAAKAEEPPQAAIATAHPLATQAGELILRQGGNAFDAAVAITAALAVVEPYSSGLGGGGFWLLHQQQLNRDIMLDGREKAPAKAHPEMYLDAQEDYLPQSSVDGALAAGIPGTVAGMVHLSENYGVLPLKQLLQPAIELAEQGFPVTEHYREMAAFRHQVLLQSAVSASIFLSAGEVPELQTLIKQPDLARTLRAIATKGQKGFYTGEVALRLVNGVKKAGGIWSLDDLKNYQLIERTPIRFKYRDMQVVSVAPPSSGGVALATMLQILQAYELSTLSSVEQKHLIIEAMRRAYRDRAEYLADSDFVPVPVRELIRPSHADRLRESIRLQQATPSQSLPGYSLDQLQRAEGSDTTHFSILDTQGNRVAATLSINYPFGSGLTIAGTGVLLNDEMDDFSVKPGVPNVYGLVGAEANAIEPGKRPLSSMSPAFVETDEGIAILGTPGGSRIITMVLLGILSLEKGEQAQQWVSIPRFHHQYLPDQVQYEVNAFSTEEVKQLSLLGHKLKPLQSSYGNMQVIWWDYKQGVQAASDPRVEGQASVLTIKRKIAGKKNPEVSNGVNNIIPLNSGELVR